MKNMRVVFAREDVICRRSIAGDRYRTEALWPRVENESAHGYFNSIWCLSVPQIDS